MNNVPKFYFENFLGEYLQSTNICQNTEGKLLETVKLLLY